MKIQLKYLCPIITILASCFISGCDSIANDTSATTNAKPITMHKVSYNQNAIDVDPASQTATTATTSASSNAISEAPTPSSTPFFLSSFSSEGDLWSDLRDDFQIDHYEDQPRVQQEVNWYLDHKSKLYYALNNSAPYLYYILQEVKARHLPGEFALLPVIESAYDPFATSDRGASGLWQLMPQTASGFGLKHDFWFDGRRDVYDSTQAALNYLTYLGNFFNGNWLYVLAAYDSGEGNIQRDIQFNAERNLPTDFWSLPLPHETAYYVPELLALALIIKHPDKYGITLPPVKDGPYFQSVDVNSQLDLSNIAKLANTSLSDIEMLNTGLSHKETDPHLLNRVLLPIGTIATFEQNLDKFAGLHTNNNTAATASNPLATTSDNSAPQTANNTTSILASTNTTNAENTTPITSQPVSQTAQTNTNYTVKHGDSLYEIARKFHVNVAQLETANNIYHHQIHPGQSLVIPGQNQTQTTSAVLSQATNIPQVQENIVANPQQNHSSKNSSANTQIATQNSSSSSTYVLKPGDNLWTVAEKLGVSPEKLKIWNGIHSTRDLKPGEQLVYYPSTKTDNNNTQTIAAKSPSDLASSSRNKPENLNTEKSITATYHVKNGDTLTSIAKKLGISIKTLKENNPSASDHLHLGEVLVVPG